MKVLFVDAGNYCRSPAAEVVARRIAAQAGEGGWSFASAGLKDKHAGGPADPRSVDACAARGYDLAGFRCREIGAADFAGSDLILAMDRDNLAELEARRPPGNRVRIELFLGDADVPDPYYGGDDGFQAMMDQIESGVRRLLAGAGAGR
jgi:protein-tyrosine phosphatase